MKKIKKKNKRKKNHESWKDPWKKEKYREEMNGSPKTKSKPSEAGSIWKGGATEWVRDDFL